MITIPETLTCRKCSVKKGFAYFKSFEDNLVYGVCNICAKSKRQTIRRLNKSAKTAELANQIMSDAVKKIESLYKNHSLTLDLQLVTDGIFGLINVSTHGHKECKEIAIDRDYEPSFPISDMVMKQILWPISMYVYAKTGYNQVITPKILGMSRNTFRKILFQVSVQSPDLVKKYKAENYMPKQTKIKLSQDDYSEEVFIRRIDTPKTLVIHSNIQDRVL